MAIELDLFCKPCEQFYTLTAESAPDDDNLIDVIVCCKGCNRTLNTFISIDEMMEIPQEHDHES